MNGVHDMGGMQGMGALAYEKDEPVFHEPWEARVFALRRAMGAWRKWNIDVVRHSVERLPPDEYLRTSYYERQLLAFIELMIERGFLTREEAERGTPEAGSAKATPAHSPERAAAMISKGIPVTRDIAITPAFGAGQKVRTRNMHPEGHTRLPRYARGKRGTIERDHGVHVFPDTNAHGLGENPQHLYSVRFAARELWGESASPRDSVYLDLWEDYLEPA
jgi:nitrile hydratase